MLCPRCGAQVGEKMRLCESCKSNIGITPLEQSIGLGSSNADPDPEYAEGFVSNPANIRKRRMDTSRSMKVGFFEEPRPAPFESRVLAQIIDVSIVIMVASVFGEIARETFPFLSFLSLLENVFRGMLFSGQGVIVNFCLIILSTYFIFGTVYFTVFECSRFKATPGKRLLNLEVITNDMEEISFFRSLLRHLFKLLSISSLGLGFLMAIVNKESKTLHDELSKTRVVTPQEVNVPWVIGVCFVAAILLFMVMVRCSSYLESKGLGAKISLVDYLESFKPYDAYEPPEEDYRFKSRRRDSLRNY